MLHNVSRVAVLIGSIVACSGCASPTLRPADAGGIEALIARYFERVEVFDYPGMRSMSTPDIEVLDVGYRLDQQQFEDFIRTSCQQVGCRLDFTIANFRTRVQAQTADTSYELVSPPALKFFGVTHLRRVAGDWKIDKLVLMRQAETALPVAMPPTEAQAPGR